MGGGIGSVRDHMEEDSRIATARGFSSTEAMKKHDYEVEAKAQSKREKVQKALSKTQLNNLVQEALKMSDSVIYEDVLIEDCRFYIKIGNNRLVHETEFLKNLRRLL